MRDLLQGFDAFQQLANEGLSALQSRDDVTSTEWLACFS